MALGLLVAEVAQVEQPRVRKLPRKQRVAVVGGPVVLTRVWLVALLAGSAADTTAASTTVGGTPETARVLGVAATLQALTTNVRRALVLVCCFWPPGARGFSLQGLGTFYPWEWLLKLGGGERS